MRPIRIPIPASAIAPPSQSFDAFVEALRGETRLLEELARILRRQRSGVSENDLEVLDDSVYSAQRVLLTLQQARRRRRSLLDLLTGREDAPLGDLDQILGHRMTDELRRARNELLAAAEGLGRELELNRRVLRFAAHAGDRLIRALIGAPESSTMYGPESGDTGAPGALLNTQA